MPRSELKSDTKGIAFGVDHAMGVFLQVWKRPDNERDRERQDMFGPNWDEMLIDLDNEFDGLDLNTLLTVAEQHGFDRNAIEEVMVREILG